MDSRLLVQSNKKLKEKVKFQDNKIVLLERKLKFLISEYKDTLPYYPRYTHGREVLKKITST